MAISDGFFAHGSTVSIGGAPIDGLTNIRTPSRQKGSVRTTHHGSDGDHSFVPGLRDGGEIVLEYNLLPEDAGQDALETNYEANGVTATFVITLADAATSATTFVTYTFTGFVTASGPDDLPGDEDSPATGSSTIKVAGAVAREVA